MHRREEDIRIVPEDFLGSISVMDIDVDYRDATEIPGKEPCGIAALLG